MKRILFLVLVVLAGAVWADVTVYSPSGTITGNYTTIQKGVASNHLQRMMPIQQRIDACPVGGTVSIYAGTYNEAIYINKRIALVGIGTPTITASGLGNTNTVTFSGTATNNASISGFKITGAMGTIIGEGKILGGAGIFCHYATITITNNIISENYIAGIFCGSSSPTITNNTITGNSWWGIISYSHSSGAITNNVITDNDGGIVCSDFSSPTIVNNTILRNDDCGIFCEDFSSPTITNNTISNNGYGIYGENSSSPFITNNIITSNGTTNTDCYGIYNSDGNPAIDYNCVWGNGSPTTHNYYNCSHKGHDISTNPQFIAGADFHLGSSSPCIDKGLNTASAIPSTDKDGKPRIVNGTVDIGAYEFQGTSTPPVQYGSLTITSFPSGAKIYLDSTDTGYVTNWIFTNISAGTHTIKLTLSNYKDWYGTATVITGLTTYIYATLTAIQYGTLTITSFPSGAKIYIDDADTGSVTTRTFTISAGTHSIKLTLVNYQDWYGTVAVIAGSTTYVYATLTQVPLPPPVVGSVTVYNALGGFVGTYTFIQAGVNACPTGGTVSVSAGTYTEVVSINKRIALVGIGTPTITASPGLGATNTVTFDGNATDNASISGFRITGATGIWPDGNGIYCRTASPFITNNIITGNNSDGIDCWDNSTPFITNNTISGNGEEGIYCNSSSPFITNNTISGNSYNGINCYKNSSPAITNNTISGNGYHGINCGSSFPFITNNTILGNSYNGIVCYSSSPPIITNNTISGNTYHGIVCDSSSPTITNNIIRSHTSYGIYEYDTTSDPSTNYNCFYNNTKGAYYDKDTGQAKDVNWLNTTAGYTGNISANPQFIGGVDYRLQSTSPCIDKGLNTAPGIPAKDKDGKSRIVNGIVDMGAYEFQGTSPPPPSVGTVTVYNALGGFVGTYTTIQAGVNNCPVGGTVSVAAGTYTEAVSINKRITLIGKGTPTITAGGLGYTNTVTFDGNDTDNASISGFRITGATGDWPNGSGIYCTNGSPTINYNTISGNSFNGIHCHSSSPFINHNTISGNSSHGIACCYSSFPLITNNTISGNNGSGIFCDSSSPNITNCVITGNTADSGGGILCQVFSSPTITSCVITGNTATSGGGILCGNNSSPSITSCVITGNTATSGGGILCDNSSSPNITNCVITGNTATNYGGGIFCQVFSSPNITDCTISGNTANSGGGIYCCARSSPNITNCVITGNRATTAGGGIWYKSSCLKITNCEISGNTAQWGGGICCCFSSPSPNITNCVIKGNGATTSGGGIYCNNSSPNITNCVITGNNANSTGGGILCYDNSSPTITNNIIVSNTNYNIYKYDISSNPSINYNCVWNNNNSSENYYDCSGGLGSITANPQFIGGDDFHLQPNSPCIDKGLNTAPGIPSTDKDGNPRIRDGDGNGTLIVDMGAYEIILSSYTIEPGKEKIIEREGTKVHFPAGAISGTITVVIRLKEEIKDELLKEKIDRAKNITLLQGGLRQFEVISGEKYFNQLVLIQIPYTVTLSEDVDRLRIFRLNEFLERWELVRDGINRPNKTDGVVEAEVRSFSVYAIGFLATDEPTVFNYPNPARGQKTTFAFYSKNPEDVSIHIYDLAYRWVETLKGYERINGSFYERDWGITNIARGVYLCVFKDGEKEIVKKVMVIKGSH